MNAKYTRHAGESFIDLFLKSHKKQRSLVTCKSRVFDIEGWLVYGIPELPSPGFRKGLELLKPHLRNAVQWRLSPMSVYLEGCGVATLAEKCRSRAGQAGSHSLRANERRF